MLLSTTWKKKCLLVSFVSDILSDFKRKVSVQFHEQLYTLCIKYLTSVSETIYVIQSYWCGNIESNDLCICSQNQICQIDDHLDQLQSRKLVRKKHEVIDVVQQIFRDGIHNTVLISKFQNEFCVMQDSFDNLDSLTRRIFPTVD